MYCVVGVDKDILEGLGICPGHLGVIKWSISLCSLYNVLLLIPGKIFAPSAQRTFHKFSAERNNRWSCDRAPALGQAWFAASATCAPVTFVGWIRWSRCGQGTLTASSKSSADCMVRYMVLLSDIKFVSVASIIGPEHHIRMIHFSLAG